MIKKYYNSYGLRFLKHFSLYCNFVKDYLLFKKQSNTKLRKLNVLWKDKKVFLKDKETSLTFNRHYVYHLAWAARIMKRTLPDKHIDISSSIYFSTMVSAFIPTYFYEFRPMNLNLDGLYNREGNLTALPFRDDSIMSLSSMHVIEHIGLGRYGDPIDSDGDLKAVSELKRVMKIGGNLLIVVPVGKPKVVFNAHRIYSYKNIVGMNAETIVEK